MFEISIENVIPLYNANSNDWKNIFLKFHIFLNMSIIVMYSILPHVYFYQIG